ncbi:hypothetical protein ACLH0M_14655 [Aeromonas media]
MSAHYFRTYVVPAYDAWQSNPQDIRLAKTLASGLNDIAEHYWRLSYKTSPEQVASTPTVRKYREYIARILPEFALIRDVADCHKHLFLDRPSAQVKSDNDITVEHTGYGQAYGLRYGGGKVVTIVMDNGDIAYFDFIAEKVYQYWAALLT